MDAKEKDMQSTKGRKLCVKWSLHSFGNSFSNSQQLKRWLVIFFHAIDADVRVCFSFWFKMRPLFQWVLYLNSEKFKKQKQRIQVRKKLKYFSVIISFSMGCVVLFNKPLLILSCHQSISLYSRMKCISLKVSILWVFVFYIFGYYRHPTASLIITLRSKRKRSFGGNNKLLPKVKTTEA